MTDNELDSFTPEGTSPTRWAQIEEEERARGGESTQTKQEPKSSNNSTQSQSRELKTQQPASDLDTEIGKIREEFRTHFTKCDELIKRLGNAIKKAGIVKQSDICHEIKNILAEEIADQNISVRTIDRCCPDEWKRITKPKKKDNLSFSKPDLQIVMMQGGKSETLPQEITPRGHSVEEKSASTQTIDSEPAKQDIEKPATSISTSVEQESTAANTQPPQQSQLQQNHLRILIDGDELSDKMSELDKGIKNFWLCGRIENHKLLDMVLEREMMSSQEEVVAQ